MTTFELYRKHKSGEISREKFLYEVRRDNNLPFITNLTSYDDAVKILKNKGIVTEGQTKEAKADEAVKAEVKAKAPSTKKPESLHIDQANPYEYRHGLQYELNELGEYTDEALEKAKDKVLKNLAKDTNFYSNLLNTQQSPYTFKQTETDAPGMQAKADGHLKKEAKKDEKSNVQDSLGKKEEGSKKPKGVKVMPDKGVTGSEKTIKEGLKEDSKDPYDKVKVMKVKDKFEVYTTQDGKIKTFDTEAEAKEFADKMNKKGMKEIMPGVDLGASFEKMKGEMSAEDEFESLVKKYDWYAEMSDDPRKWSAQQSMEADLRQLSKTIGVDKAVEIFNRYAPSDRKVTSSDTMWGMKEDKHTKIKEALKKALKEADPALTKLEKDEETAEKNLANILKKKADILNKPGTQG